ncbi:MAG TPA: putative metal-binding protein [Allosphingosinicella sp.]|jgi:hypothetical protein|nr:putative metal-binding protein [Allosphingosinicella sp.]
MTGQVVDPKVSKAKFDREVDQFRRLGAMHLQRGWWLMSAEFPVVEIGFVTPGMRPPALILCARIDFTNYDLWAPSVQFVDPFTKQALGLDAIVAPFLRLGPDGPQRILQGHPGRPAFLCLPGTREYHDHPAHSGDSWLLRRGQGEGGLLFVADKISTYGSEPIRGWHVEMRPAIEQVPA